MKLLLTILRVICISSSAIIYMVIINLIGIPWYTETYIVSVVICGIIACLINLMFDRIENMRIEDLVNGTKRGKFVHKFNPGDFITNPRTGITHEISMIDNRRGVYYCVDGVVLDIKAADKHYKYMVTKTCNKYD